MIDLHYSEIIRFLMRREAIDKAHAMEAEILLLYDVVNEYADLPAEKDRFLRIINVAVKDYTKLLHEV